jgi:hypothetical protein
MTESSLEVEMRKLTALLVVPLIVLTALPSVASGQERHVVERSALARTVEQHVSQQDADRTAVREALGRPEVREVAARAGLDLDLAMAKVDTFDGDDLARVADSARQVNDALVGGQSRVTISTTTIIIALLVIILIIVAVD